MTRILTLLAQKQVSKVEQAESSVRSLFSNTPKLSLQDHSPHWSPHLAISLATFSLGQVTKAAETEPGT